MPITPDTLKKLALFDTPTICNVIELFEVRPRTAGFMDARIKANFPEMPPMVGFASTASFRSGAFPGKGDAYGSMEKQVEGFAELPGPAVMVFQDLDDPAVGATFGEVMCSTYKGFGSVGLITSGGGRDLAQVDGLGFPTFTSGAIAAHGYCHFPQINVPVTVGGMVIYTGDLLHGDLNGVTRIPHEIAGEVAHVCEEIAKAEAIILNYLKQPSVTVAEFDAARAECTSMINALGKRLRGEK